MTTLIAKPISSTLSFPTPELPGPETEAVPVKLSALVVVLTVTQLQIVHSSHDEPYGTSCLPDRCSSTFLTPLCQESAFLPFGRFWPRQTRAAREDKNKQGRRHSTHPWLLLDQGLFLSKSLTCINNVTWVSEAGAVPLRVHPRGLLQAPDTTPK